MQSIANLAGKDYSNQKKGSQTSAALLRRPSANNSGGMWVTYSTTSAWVSISLGTKMECFQMIALEKLTAAHNALSVFESILDIFERFWDMSFTYLGGSIWQKVYMGIYLPMWRLIVVLVFLPLRFAFTVSLPSLVQWRQLRGSLKFASLKLG